MSLAIPTASASRSPLPSPHSSATMSSHSQYATRPHHHQHHHYEQDITPRHQYTPPTGEVQWMLHCSAQPDRASLQTGKSAIESHFDWLKHVPFLHKHHKHSRPYLCPLNLSTTRLIHTRLAILLYHSQFLSPHILRRWSPLLPRGKWSRVTTNQGQNQRRRDRTRGKRSLQRAMVCL